MFKRGRGLELLLILWGMELSSPCPHHCICYTTPSTVSCQAHNFLSVPEGIPPQSERIYLQNNKIRQLRRGHFSPAIVMLWLYSNDIASIEASTFHGFERLEDLDLGDNRNLRSLAPDTFRGLGRLHALHLYHCGLGNLPGGIFQGLHSLQYLYLQDNQLDFLEDDLFVDLLNLSHLFLHGNRLWSLHQNTFRGLGGLDRLLLHHNRLQWVDQLAFHDLRRLTTLYLFNNSLAQLPGQCLAQLPALEYLRLNDNPWECDCKALSLWDWLRRFRGSTSALGCQTPPELAGRDLKHLRKEELPSCTSGSESLHRGKGSPHQHPHLPHQDQRYPVAVSPSPPLPSTKPGRSRNCTRQRSRGPKGKWQNEALDKESSDIAAGGGKYVPGNSDGSPPRRKHKCGPRTSMRPPSGVQQASNWASACLPLPLLQALVGLLLSLTAVILR